MELTLPSKGSQNTHHHPDESLLTIVYPPGDIQLPVESPVQVWVFYGRSDGSGIGNQPIQFTSHANTAIISADAATDADGFAHAVVRLSKPGTLGKKATFDGSLRAQITNAQEDPNASLTCLLHASTSAGGPGKIEMGSWDSSGLDVPPAINLMRLTHTLADGTPSNSANLSCLPSDSSRYAYFINPVAIGDSRGNSVNFAIEKILQRDPLNTGLRASATNAIAGRDDIAELPPVNTYHPGGVTGGTGSLKIGPVEDMTRQELPNNTRIPFKAIFLDENGNPQSGACFRVYGRSEGDFTIEPPAVNYVTAVTNERGEAFFSVAVGDNGVVLGLRAAAWYPGEGYAYRVDDVETGWVGLFYDQDKPPFVQESVTLTPPSDQSLTLGAGYDVKARVLQGYNPKTHEPYLPVVGQTVIWSSDQPDRVVFSPVSGPVNQTPGTRFPTVTDSKGDSAIRISALGSRPFTATITAKVANRETGTYFCGSATVKFGVENQSPITIKSQGRPPLSLYDSHELSASYNVADNRQQWLTWSAIIQESVDSQSKEHHVHFDPNPSQTNEKGQTSTKIIGYGSEPFSGTVDVYARIYDADANSGAGGVDAGSLELSFDSGTPQFPSMGVVSLTSLDGDPLSDGQAHLVQAVYTKLDGTPLAYQPISWQISPSNKFKLLTTQPTWTDANGLAVNGVVSYSTVASVKPPVVVTASAVNPITRKTDQGSLPLTFVRGGVTYKDTGYMRLESKEPSPLSIGGWHDLTVTYLTSDGITPEAHKDITWAAFPADRLQFKKGLTKTSSAGVATNSVRCLPGPDLANAAISASSPNVLTYTDDSVQLIRGFRNIVPTPSSGLIGMMIDKAYAHIPGLGGTLDPSNRQQVIKCNIKAAIANPAEQAITLTTNPSLQYLTSVVMFDADGNPMIPKDYAYTVATDEQGIATFMIGSRRLANFELIARMGTDAPISTTIVSALISDDLASPRLPPPEVPAIDQHGNLPIPSERPAPSFKVTIPSSEYVENSYSIAVLVNDRLVFMGSGLEAQANGGVDIAYATLKPNGNKLVYLATDPATGLTRESPEPTGQPFTSSGIAQTVPDTGGAPRILPPAIIETPTSNIDMADIVNGLYIGIPPYDQMEAGEDIITVFFYLSGQDALTSQPITNIVSIPHSLTSEDPLFSHNLLTLTLPQACLAGYAHGSLQVDYKVVNGNGTRWSGITSATSLNTTSSQVES